MYARALKKSLKIDLALKLSQSRTNLYEFLFAGPRRTSPKLGGKKSQGENAWMWTLQSL